MAPAPAARPLSFHQRLLAAVVHTARGLRACGRHLEAVEDQLCDIDTHLLVQLEQAEHQAQAFWLQQELAIYGQVLGGLLAQPGADPEVAMVRARKLAATSIEHYRRHCPQARLAKKNNNGKSNNQ